jgi:hypothetical protein
MHASCPAFVVVAWTSLRQPTRVTLGRVRHPIRDRESLNAHHLPEPPIQPTRMRKGPFSVTSTAHTVPSRINIGSDGVLRMPRQSVGFTHFALPFCSDFSHHDVSGMHRQSLRGCITQLNEYLRGWIGFFGIMTRPRGRGGLDSLDAHIRRRLRAIVLRHWRRKRRSGAWQPAKPGRRSWWALSHTPRVERVLSNAFFAARGLVSLEAEWRRRQPSLLIAPVQLALELG